MSFLISLSHSKSPFSFPFSFPFLFSHCRRASSLITITIIDLIIFLSSSLQNSFIITRNPSTFLPNLSSSHVGRFVWSLAFSGLVARRTTVWLREWVKASTFLVFLGLCFHSKAFLIVPFLFLVSFSPYVFSGGGVRFPAGDVAAGGGWSFSSHCLGPFP